MRAFTKDNHLKKGPLLLSFLIPVFLLLIILIFAKVYPFGDRTLVIWDCSGQYIDFFASLKSVFFGNNNLFYTFSKTLGGDMVGLSSYYLLSPVNLLFLLFPNAYLPVALSIVILIKLGLCGLTFFYFLNKTYGQNRNQLIFSTTYALMGYNMAYFWNVMWIDGVILLPLLVLGLERLIAKKRPLLYIFVLALAIITNYYIGFMLSIFSILYFIYRTFLRLEKLKDLKSYGKTVLTYTGASFLSAGLACFVLIPTVFSLQGGKALFSWKTLGFFKNFDFIDVFQKLYTTSLSIEHMDRGTFPNIFCGIFVLTLVLLYFLNAKVPFKQKLLDLSFLAVFFISFYINTFNLIWHGLNAPTCFPYRYSFIFCFLLIWIAYKGYCHQKTNKQKHYLLCALIFIIATVVIFRNTLDFITMKVLVFDVFLCGTFCLLLYFLIHKESRKNLVIAVILLLTVADLCLHGYNSVRQLQDNYSPTMSKYVDYIKTTGAVINKVKANDAGFYRLEKTFKRCSNDSMQFNYNGLTHYSSCEKTFVKLFMRKMGFRASINTVTYPPGYAVASDSFFGVKYLLSQKAVDKPYDALFTENNITVYQNPYALPLGLVVDKDILNVHSEINTGNTFQLQNKLWNAMDKDQTDDIFVPAEVIHTAYENVDVSQTKETTFYQKIHQGDIASITYTLAISSNHNVFMYLPAKTWSQDASVLVNGKWLAQYFGESDDYMLDLGHFQPGATVTVELRLRNDITEIDHSYFYYENTDVLKAKYDALSNQFCDIKELSSSHLTGTVDVEKDQQQLFFTIPYSEDWHLYIDGKRVGFEEAVDALISAPIAAGQHTFELYYVPKGLYWGIIVSAVSVCVLISLGIVKKYKGSKT